MSPDQELIQKLKKTLIRIIGLSGHPDAAQGCRNIIVVAAKAVKEIDMEDPNFQPTLASKVEEISDDFQSTFKVISSNVLQNMIGDNEFEELRGVIRKHCKREVKFNKIVDMPPRSMYIIMSED